MVKANTLTPEALIEALEAGSFYASTGVTLEDVSYKNHTLTVSVKPEPGIVYTIDFIGVLKGTDKSSVSKTIKGATASFKVTQKYLFVRARITSNKKKENPYQENDVEMAWTQPVEFRE